MADGQARAYVLVRKDAGAWEARAAHDLAETIHKMTGADVPVVNQRLDRGLALVVGELALPHLRTQLERVAKKNPVLRADAIAIQTEADGIYLAGSNDDSHYFAVAELMRRWGCRWYLPTDFGECIPKVRQLRQETLRYAYAPPFELRGYWISWNGDSTGYPEFTHRNFMNCQRVPAAHALGQYVTRVQAKLGSFKVSSPETARAVADLVADDYASSRSFSLSMEDESVLSTAEQDRDLAGHLRDKYFQTESLSDAYLTFYNRVCQALRTRFPKSTSRIGFLAYINLTLPPQREAIAQPPLIAFLAPIDIDPNHPFTDPRWSSRADYLGALRGWVRAMQGRVVLYDYDQSMLVWRDLPNPSHQVLRAEIKEYARLGILGFDTESRNALATTFLNLYFRGQLYWNPDLDVQAELSGFYPRFFGPAAKPMERYWNLIYQTWATTKVTEHEFFVIPALYPRPLVESLGKWLAQTRSIHQQPYRSRLDFVEHSWSILDGYTLLLERSSKGDFAGAVEAGERALAEREKLTSASGIFTTYKNYPESGPAFFPGEVALMREFQQLSRRRILQSPIQWGYRSDADDHGVWQGWPNQNEGWQAIRSDLYLQAQRPDTRPGYAWYRWEFDLQESPTIETHLLCPGLFNESWLYLNGHLIGHRAQKELWWLNDYKFTWDVALQGLKAGHNSIVIRNKVGLHFAGLFRPPFLYQP